MTKIQKRKTTMATKGTPGNGFFRSSNKVHFNNSKGGLGGANGVIPDIQDIGPDKDQVAGPVEGFGRAGKRPFFGRGQ